MERKEIACAIFAEAFGRRYKAFRNENQIAELAKESLKAADFLLAAIEAESPAEEAPEQPPAEQPDGGGGGSGDPGGDPGSSGDPPAGDAGSSGDPGATQD